MEATRYPKNCVTEEAKWDYVQRVKRHEGIILNPDKIVYNAGRRTVAKLCLNNFWGKLLRLPIEPPRLLWRTRVFLSLTNGRWPLGVRRATSQRRLSVRVVQEGRRISDSTAQHKRCDRSIRDRSRPFGIVFLTGAVGCARSVLRHWLGYLQAHGRTLQSASQWVCGWNDRRAGWQSHYGVLVQRN